MDQRIQQATCVESEASVPMSSGQVSPGDSGQGVIFSDPYTPDFRKVEIALELSEALGNAIRNAVALRGAGKPEAAADPPETGDATQPEGSGQTEDACGLDEETVTALEGMVSNVENSVFRFMISQGRQEAGREVQQRLEDDLTRELGDFFQVMGLRTGADGVRTAASGSQPCGCPCAGCRNFTGAAGGSGSGGVADGQSEMTVGEVAEHYLKDIRTRKSVKVSSRQLYETNIKNHILPELGNCRIVDVNKAVITEFIGCLQRKGLASSTQRGVLSVLKSILRHAASLCPGFVAPEVDLPRLETAYPRILSRDETKRLLEELKDRDDPFTCSVLLMLTTGMRVGEVCGLRYGDINIEEGYVKVCRTVQRIRKENPQDGEFRTCLSISTPKTKTSVRQIPLTPIMIRYLKRNGLSDSDVYVASGTTQPKDPRTIQNHIRKLFKKAGIGEDANGSSPHSHSLRHTYATFCAQVCMEVKCITQNMGHSNVAVTLNLYTHPTLDTRIAQIAKLTEVGF